MPDEDKMESMIKLYFDESSRLLELIDKVEVTRFVSVILLAYERGSKIFVCGNGGNAAYVANLAVDLNIHPFVSTNKSESGGINRRKGFSCIDLCSHGATLTGILNDRGGDRVFADQMIALDAQKEDVLIGFTGSGTSKNVVAALREAKQLGMTVVMVTRKPSSPASLEADVSLTVPATSTFPGQTGSNDGNFHFEDMLSKISHIAVGALWEHVRNA